MKQSGRRPSMWVVGVVAVLAVTAAVVTGVALQAVRS